MPLIKFLVTDEAGDELLTAHRDVLPINPCPAKAEMQTGPVRHVESLKRFSRSNTDLYQPITAAEAAELKNLVANLYKLMQLIVAQRKQLLGTSGCRSIGARR